MRVRKLFWIGHDYEIVTHWMNGLENIGYKVYVAHRMRLDVEEKKIWFEANIHCQVNVRSPQVTYEKLHQNFIAFGNLNDDYEIVKTSINLVENLVCLTQPNKHKKPA